MHLLQTGADPSALRCRSGDAGARPDDPGHPGRRQPARPPWRGALFQGFLQRPSLWPSQRRRCRQPLRHHGRGSARLRPQPLGARAACKIAVAGDITAPTRRRSCSAIPSSPCPAATPPPLPADRAGWAIPACMCCRCRCRSPPSCSACRASCAPIPISFPAMSPIIFWAAADFPRA